MPSLTTARIGTNIPDYIPTTDEIRAACAEIQGEWTESERRRRAGLGKRLHEIRIRRLPRELLLSCDWGDAA